MDLYGRAKSRIACALHKLIPTKDQGRCSPTPSPINWHYFPVRSTHTNESEKNIRHFRTTWSKASTFTKRTFINANVTYNGRGQIHIQVSSTLSIIYLSIISILRALVALVSQFHFFIIAAAPAAPTEGTKISLARNAPLIARVGSHVFPSDTESPRLFFAQSIVMY